MLKDAIRTICASPMVRNGECHTTSCRPRYCCQRRATLAFVCRWHTLFAIPCAVLCVAFFKAACIATIPMTGVHSIGMPPVVERATSTTTSHGTESIASSYPPRPDSDIIEPWLKMSVYLSHMPEWQFMRIDMFFPLREMELHAVCLPGLRTWDRKYGMMGNIPTDSNSLIGAVHIICANNILWHRYNAAYVQNQARGSTFFQAVTTCVPELCHSI